MSYYSVSTPYSFAGDETLYVDIKRWKDGEWHFYREYVKYFEEGDDKFINLDIASDGPLGDEYEIFKLSYLENHYDGTYPRDKMFWEGQPVELVLSELEQEFCIEAGVAPEDEELRIELTIEIANKKQYKRHKK